MMTTQTMGKTKREKQKKEKRKDKGAKGKKGGAKGAKGAKGKGKKAPLPHKHVLYEASVQGVECDLDFLEEIYGKLRGRPFRTIREDFCGTAAFACEWIRRGEEHEAWGVDLDQPTLDWGVENHVAGLGDAASRLTLLNENVLDVKIPPVDVIVALNYSYWVFKERKTLLGYFESCRRGLNEGGVLCLDLFGGTESMQGEIEERSDVEKSRGPNGEKVPAFTYYWNQAEFDPITHDFLCHIHFKVDGRAKQKKVFTYDWRLWTIPELRDLLLEAGFAGLDVYIEGFDEATGEGDGEYEIKTTMENEDVFLAYLIART